MNFFVGPWNKDILSQAADEDGITVAKREISKDNKYSSELDVWGSPSNASHWSLNILVIGGRRQTKFSMNCLSNPEKRNFEFKTYWRCCFSVTLQRCNASVIRHKLEKLSSLLEVG